MLVGDSSKGCAGRRRADQVAQRAWCIELQRAARRDARLCRLVRGASLERLRSSFVAQYTELKALSRRHRDRKSVV